ILDQYNVKATFFTTSAYPAYAYCMGKAAAAGHTVCVHSQTHNYAQIYSSEEAYWADFNAQNEVIAAQTGSYSTMFRFPGGSSNTVSRSYNTGIMSRLAAQASQYGYTYFDWNVSSGDAGETTSTSVVYQNVISGIQWCSNNGVPAVVLQHDVKSYSVAAVADIIEWGLENGYTFAALTPGSYAPHHGINN
ncbi:MAG: polysaccharide deacetylase, partial [Erysipelotrichaceae bacterium]|nr:polysaccharide deacetylase [Erysipelotrichaceae bacterium]